MTGLARFAGWVGLLAAAVWLGGFVRFVDDIQSLREPALSSRLEKADAIIVLTGGSERVTTGLELLESGIGKKLFITGVHKGLSLDGVLGAQPVSAELRDCCIVLGHQAGSTVGNAEETKDWLRGQDYFSLRLVTANYHMPRSMLLFRAAMPEVKIIPHPVTPDSVRLYEWWRHPHTVQLLATEYSKYLYVDLRLTLDRLRTRYSSLALPFAR